MAGKEIKGTSKIANYRHGGDDTSSQVAMAKKIDLFDFFTTQKQKRRNIHQWKRKVKWPTKKGSK